MTVVGAVSAVLLSCVCEGGRVERGRHGGDDAARSPPPLPPFHLSHPRCLSRFCLGHDGRQIGLDGVVGRRHGEARQRKKRARVSVRDALSSSHSPPTVSNLSPFPGTRAARANCSLRNTHHTQTQVDRPWLGQPGLPKAVTLAKSKEETEQGTRKGAWALAQTERGPVGKGGDTPPPQLMNLHPAAAVFRRRPPRPTLASLS